MGWGVAACSAFRDGHNWAVEVVDPRGDVVGLADYTTRPEHARRRHEDEGES